MRKIHLVFGSIALIAVLVMLLTSPFAGAGSSETLSVATLNDSGEDGSFGIDAPEQIEQVSFSAPGKVAVYDVEVTGTGVLMVDTSDYNPESYPDIWRATILTMRDSGPGAWAVTDEAATWCGRAGSGTWGEWTGRADMMVIEGYTYIVQISYDYGSDIWTAGCRIRFRYTGPSFTITGPRDGF